MCVCVSSMNHEEACITWQNRRTGTDWRLCLHERRNEFIPLSITALLLSRLQKWIYCQCVASNSEHRDRRTTLGNKQETQPNTENTTEAAQWTTEEQEKQLLFCSISLNEAGDIFSIYHVLLGIRLQWTLRPTIPDPPWGPKASSSPFVTFLGEIWMILFGPSLTSYCVLLIEGPQLLAVDLPAEVLGNEVSWSHGSWVDSDLWPLSAPFPPCHYL